MTFNSWEFIVFYPVVLLLWFVLPRAARMPMLLLASYLFYMLYQPSLIILILTTTLVSWLSSRAIEKTESRPKKKLALALTLVASLGTLFFYKYFDFLLGSVSGLVALFGGTPSSLTLGLVLPVGISFYTFQTLSYVIDVYRGDVAAERNFFYYALFVSFFPQLVAGPIERPENLLPQLKAAPRWSSESAVRGAEFMLLGFFKKICVADMLSTYVDSVYNAPAEAGSLAIALATVFFAIQIYCDFSGYTDIAIGCARIMGIRLMKNFDHPYSATTVTEFWSRWHISLSSWFKDYLYIPLGGSRCSKPRHLLNLFLVFLVSGLWHGAAWTFVLWGAVHGIYRVASELTLKKRNALLARARLTPESPAVVALRRVNTFVLVTFAWLLFRANSVSDAATLIGRLFTAHVGVSSTFAAMGLGAPQLILLVFSVVALFFMDRLLVFGDSEDGSSALVKNGSFVYVVWAVLFVWLLLLSEDKISSFIYFQF